VGEEGVLLEDEPDAASIGREIDALFGVQPDFAVERDASTRRAHEAGDHGEHGRLAGTGGTDQREDAVELER
jgi:hypothetical protein